MSEGDYSAEAISVIRTFERLPTAGSGDCVINIWGVGYRMLDA